MGWGRCGRRVLFEFCIMVFMVASRSQSSHHCPQGSPPQQCLPDSGPTSALLVDLEPQHCTSYLAGRRNDAILSCKWLLSAARS